MELRDFVRGLKGRFVSLEEYLEYLRERSLGEEIALCDEVDRWGRLRLGIISMASVRLSPSIYFFGTHDYAAGVDVRSKRIGTVCDLSGVAVRDVECIYRSFGEDLEVIRQVTGPGSDPFDKARFVREKGLEADRILGEMMMMERREFFWCFIHGLMHVLRRELPGDVFVWCKHGHGKAGGSKGSYSEWPEI